MTTHKHVVLLTSTLFLTLLIAAAASTPKRHSRGVLRPSSGTAASQTASSNISATTEAAFKQETAPFIQKYCVSCHGAVNPPAGISLAGYHNAASVLRASALWQKVSQNVGSSHMPPAGMPQPTQAERDRLVSWIDSTLSQTDCKVQDPGRVTLRRLNRVEYDNTIRDLVGVNLHSSDDFPSDDVGYGFDNIGDVLSISPLLMEKYLAAAEKIAQATIVTPEAMSAASHFSPEKLVSSTPANYTPAGDRLLMTPSEVGVDYRFPISGEYVVRVRAYGEQAGPDPARMAFQLDGREIMAVDVKAEMAKPEVYQVRVTVSAGIHHVGFAFLNDYYLATAPNPKDRDRNLVITRVAIEGPPGMPGALPASHRRIITCHPTAAMPRDACMRKILGNFARRAYRRPVTPDEISRLIRYVKMAQGDGASFERSIQVGVEAVLVSPNFLFRVETDPHPNNAGVKRPISSYELASRLSYFLWSSMPDDELFARAAKGTLQKPQVLEAEVKRMLADPKSQALSENFAGQWLELRKLSRVAPDIKRFPEFDEKLRAAMLTETEMFFAAVKDEDRSILDFIDSDYTFLNEPLARHYGIDGVTGPGFRRVKLTGGERGGVLTQASVLTVTSNPTRTSPVKRGKWVLEQILGTPPPPPPPGVAQLDDKQAVLTGTLRQRMEQHRKDPACVTCHLNMDPLGFGLENYDAVGAWRTRDGDAPIDSSGVLPGGVAFSGPAELRKYLMTKKPAYVHAFSEKMLTYALGRGLEPQDKCYVDAIAHDVTRNGYRFSSVITAVVESNPFRNRRSGG